MSIRKEYYKTRKDGVMLFRTYSDLHLYIQKYGTEEIYDEAIDVGDNYCFYFETDQIIKDEVEEWLH